MSEKMFNTRIIHKHDTRINWNKATNFIPMAGEIIVYDADEYYDYPRVKIGDGKTTVVNLPFIDKNKADLSAVFTRENLHLHTGNYIEDYWWYVPLNYESIQIYYQGMPLYRFSKTSLSTNAGATAWEYTGICMSLNVANVLGFPTNLSTEENQAEAFYNCAVNDNFIIQFFDAQNEQIQVDLTQLQSQGKKMTYMFGYLAYIDEDGAWVRPNDWFPMPCDEFGNLALAMDLALKFSLSKTDLNFEVPEISVISNETVDFICQRTSGWNDENAEVITDEDGAVLLFTNY